MSIEGKSIWTAFYVVSVVIAYLLGTRHGWMLAGRRFQREQVEQWKKSQ